MKRLTQIENIFLVVFTIACVIFGFTYNVPDYITQSLIEDYKEIDKPFDPFWNYTFIILVRSTFVIITFLTTRLLFDGLCIKSKNKRIVLSHFIFKSIIASILLIWLTDSFDSRVTIELLKGASISGSRVSFIEAMGIPFSPKSHIVFNTILSGKFILSVLMYTSFYVLCRTYFIHQSWRNALRVFIKTRRQDISIILSIVIPLSVVILILVTMRAPIFPGSFMFVIVFIQTAICLSILSNVFWLYQKDKKPILLKKILISLGLYAYYALLIAMIFYSAISLGSISSSFSFSFYYIYIAAIIFMYILIISHVFSAIYYLIRRKAIKRHTLLVQEVAVKNSELGFLKSQINPHFLFNSLNTVYGLALGEQSPKSAEGIQKLSDMMRFMLQENTAERIPLEREIKYINDYIDFQNLRIADHDIIKMDINLDESCKGEIAPMLLIPMIENAFKHGISLDKPSWINIKLECNQNEVHLNIQNSMHQKTGRNSEESGIGLENVRQRLTILYPDRHLFQLFEGSEKFEANIKIILA